MARIFPLGSPKSTYLISYVTMNHSGGQNNHAYSFRAGLTLSVDPGEAAKCDILQAHQYSMLHFIIAVSRFNRLILVLSFQQ